MKTALSFALLISISSLPAFAEDAPSSACAEWKSAMTVDMKYLGKLEKTVMTEKTKPGIAYSQDKLLMLMGEDAAAAKEALAKEKDKMVLTKEGKVDLKGVNLRGFNLSGLNLDNVDLREADLTGANLTNASLRGAYLYKTEFAGANLNSADLSYAYLAKARFAGASLCETSLVATDLEDTEIEGAYMKGAKLDRTKNVPRSIYFHSESILHYGLVVQPEK